MAVVFWHGSGLAWRDIIIGALCAVLVSVGEKRSPVSRLITAPACRACRRSSRVALALRRLGFDPDLTRF